ncbi:MAG: chemotaxis protein CheX [Actinomycetota bacterium]|nr:chemotaxis protein CheX [Actinomycetota bacterium]
MTGLPDSGERRRSGDASPLITELIDGATVQGIAEEAWIALVGDDEFLVPLPGGPLDDALSSWVEIVGPWNGAVVLTTGRSTAEQLARCLLAEHAPPVLDDEDVEDALGELANVVGGNIKAVLPGPSVLGLPEVGTAPSSGLPADICRVDLLWRGESLTITVQGSAGVLDELENEVPL